MPYKSKKMVAVEKRFNEFLETLLPKMVTARGLTDTAEELGISKATLGYWLLKLNIKVKRVAIAPGDTVIIERTKHEDEDQES